MDCEKDINDRISGLPLFILHHILSRLPRKQAARSSVLSKRWCSVWSTFPILVFDSDDHDIDKFVTFVDTSMDKFFGHKLQIQKLDFRCSIENRHLHSHHVDKWIDLVMENGVRELSLAVTTEESSSSEEEEDDDNILPETTILPKLLGDEHDYLLPETTFIPRFVSAYGHPKLYYLEKLFLVHVRISESIIRDIINNCLNIKHLALWQISGPKTICISNLNKLESLSIGLGEGVRELESVHVDAPSLRSFSYVPKEQNLPCTINLASSNDLNHLSLWGCAITDNLFHSYLSRFLLLETLCIHDCYMLQRLRISAQRLRRLSISMCVKCDMIEIDTPNLSSFEYRTCNVPVLFSVNAHCPIKISYLLNSAVTELESSWFFKFRDFLENCKQIKVLALQMYNMKVIFNLKEFEEVSIPLKVKVDLLELRACHGEEVDHESFVDAVLWSCHPKTISVDSRGLIEQGCLKALCEKLLDYKPATCCVDSGVKCWQHDFKSAKIVKLGEIKDAEQLLDWKHLLATLPMYCKMRFALEWDFVNHGQ